MDGQYIKKYKATYDGKPVYVEVYEDWHAMNPLDDMVYAHSPLLWCEHPRYKFGDKDAYDNIVDKIRQHPDYDEMWEDWQADETDINFDLEDVHDVIRVLDKLGVYYQYVCLYEHGGLKVWLSDNPRGGKEVCQFDGSTIGICVWFDEDYAETCLRATETVDDIIQMGLAMDSWFSDYADYVSGNVYGVTVYDLETDDVLDSIGGIYDHASSLEQMVTENVNVEITGEF